MVYREVWRKVEEILGAPVYLVGGSVRDIILGREPKDYDFTTALTPEEITDRVRADGRKAYQTGARFGTIGFKLDGEFIEVTTFRTEVYEDGNRKPKVEFVNNLHHDLSRRDFTMNSIAYRDGKFIDPFNGVGDIRRELLCPVGSARERVREDPLRMLRAARFAAQMNLSIHEDIVEATFRYNHRILFVAKERWVPELDKLLVSNNPEQGLHFLAHSGLLKFIVPELALQVGYNQNSCYHALPLWEHTVGVVRGVPAETELRWAALLHDIGKPMVRTENAKTGYSNYIKHELLGAELVEMTARRLKWSNERRETVTSLVEDHLHEDSPLKAADDAAKRKERDS